MSILEELRARYNAAVEQIIKAAGAVDRRRIAPFSTWRTDAGSPHIEAVGSTLFYIVTERGEELERRQTCDPEELLYWLVQDAAFSAASDWELLHRRPNEDSRRQLFAKEIELLGAVSPAWAARFQQRHEEILAAYPYDDEAYRKARQRE